MLKTCARRLGALIVLAALGFASGPLAAGPEARLDLRYAMYWGGFHVADARLAYDPEPASYVSDLQIEAVGIAKMLTKYQGRATIEGQLGNGLGPLPERYRYRYTSRKGSRTADVTYDPATGAAIEAVSEKRGRPDSIDVPRELWRDVVDPLTAFLRIRKELASIGQGGLEEPSVQVFDGRRRYDVSAALLGREQVAVNGQRVPALRVELRLEPIAGFDDDDLRNSRAVDGPVRFQILLSDDERLIPLEVRTLNTAITLVFSLEKDCSGPTGCRLAMAGVAGR